MPKLTVDQILRIIDLWRSGKYQYEIAELFNTNQAAIGDVVIEYMSTEERKEITKKNLVQACTTPEEKRRRRDTFIKTHVKHPDMARECGLKYAQIGGKQTQKLHPGLYRETMLSTHKKYPYMSRDGGRIGGPKACETNRRNKPYWWEGVPFDSGDERRVAQIILTTPVDGVNCHIRIGSKDIDFFPQSTDKQFQNCLVEYHPWDRERTPEQYYLERLTVVANSVYRNKPFLMLVGTPEKLELFE